MGLLTNKISRGDLKPGDHIYTWRSAHIYAHHGIYVCEGKVIHFVNKKASSEETANGVLPRITPFALISKASTASSSSSKTKKSSSVCPDCGDRSTKIGVIMSCLDCFLKGDELYRVEYEVRPIHVVVKLGGTCNQSASDPVENVLHRALILLKHGFGTYNLLERNCEDFAKYCKTELLAVKSLYGISGQVTTIEACKAALHALKEPDTKLVKKGINAVKNFYQTKLSENRDDIKRVPVEKLVDGSYLDELP